MVRCNHLAIVLRARGGRNMLLQSRGLAVSDVREAARQVVATLSRYAKLGGKQDPDGPDSIFPNFSFGYMMVNNGRQASIYRLVNSVYVIVIASPASPLLGLVKIAVATTAHLVDICKGPDVTVDKVAKKYAELYLAISSLLVASGTSPSNSTNYSNSLMNLMFADDKKERNLATFGRMRRQYPFRAAPNASLPSSQFGESQRTSPSLARLADYSDMGHVTAKTNESSIAPRGWRNSCRRRASRTLASSVFVSSPTNLDCSDANASNGFSGLMLSDRATDHRIPSTQIRTSGIAPCPTSPTAQTQTQTGNTVTEWQAFDSTSDQLGIAHLRDAPLQRADTSLHGDDAVASNDSHIDMSSHTFCGENESAELGFPMGENQSVVHDISPSSPSFLATQPNISTCEGRGVSGQSDAHDEGKHLPALQLKARSNDVNAVISMACPSSSHTCEGLQLRELWQGVFHNQELYFTKLIGETKILPSRAEKDSDITIDLMLDSDEHGLFPMGTYACKGAVSQGAAVQLGQSTSSHFIRATVPIDQSHGTTEAVIQYHLLPTSTSSVYILPQVSTGRLIGFLPGHACAEPAPQYTMLTIQYAVPPVRSVINQDVTIQLHIPDKLGMPMQAFPTAGWHSTKRVMEWKILDGITQSHRVQTVHVVLLASSEVSSHERGAVCDRLSAVIASTIHGHSLAGVSASGKGIVTSDCSPDGLCNVRSTCIAVANL